MKTQSRDACEFWTVPIFPPAFWDGSLTVV